MDIIDAVGKIRESADRIAAKMKRTQPGLDYSEFCMFLSDYLMDVYSDVNIAIDECYDPQTVYQEVYL